MKFFFNRHPVKVNKIIYKTKKKIITENNKIFFKRFKVHCNIQILPYDFKFIKKNMKKLTHFNIQYTVHKPGRSYLVMKIHKPGYFDGKTYKAPIIDGTNFIFARCISSKNHVSYDKLKKADFKYSLSIIKNKNSLKKAIKRRYKKTLAHLNDKEKLSLGIAITKLLIIKRLSWRDGRAV